MNFPQVTRKAEDTRGKIKSERAWEIINPLLVVLIDQLMHSKQRYVLISVVWMNSFNTEAGDTEDEIVVYVSCIGFSYVSKKV